MSHRLAWRLALPATIICASLASGLPAGAQDAAPTPCTGMHYTDPKDDSTYIAPDPDIFVPTNPNEDLTGLFFNWKPGADGTPVLTANVQVSTLDKTETGAVYALPGGVTAWEVTFEFDGSGYALRAVLKDGAFVYSMNKRPVIGDLLFGPYSPTETPTTGSAFEGPDGIISIVAPAIDGLAPGATLLSPIVYTTVRENQLHFSFSHDVMPTSGEEKDYTVVECPAGEQTATATPTASASATATATATPTPSPSGGGGSGSGSGSGSGTKPGSGVAGQQNSGTTPAGGLLPVSGPLAISFAADKGKRKTARKRGMRVRVRCSVQCKATATATIDKKTARKLRLGKKAVKLGTGRLTITKAGRIPFYVKLSKKAKKALGRRGVKKFALKMAIQVTDLQGKQLKKGTKKVTLR